MRVSARPAEFQSLVRDSAHSDRDRGRNTGF